MPKHKKKMTASPELEAILAEPVTDADRLAEYLKRKANEVPKQDNVRLFGDFSIDLSFDVPLLKKSQEPKPTESVVLQNASILQLQDSESASAAPAAVDCDPKPPLQSPRGVRVSPSRRSASKVPDSDRLRRVAIRRRSQSCGRRQLLKEFDNVDDVLTPCVSDFRPTVNSTPCEHKKQSQTQNDLNPESEPKSGRAPEGEYVPNNVFARIAKEVEATFVRTFNVDRKTGSSRPPTPQSEAMLRTYTIEKICDPGQTLLNNSSVPVTPPAQQSAKQTSIKAPVVRLRRLNRNITVPDTPPVPAPRRRQPDPLSQPEVEVVVPETQPQELSMTANQSQQLGEIIQNLSRSSSVPLVVIPINTQSPRADAAEPNSTHNQLAKTESIDVVSRSIQTLSQPKVQDVREIMTDDDSDAESGNNTVPLNLAPPGGNTTRQKRNLNYRKPTDNQENSMQLLNLHRTNPDKRNRKATLTSVLNKAPCTPINGEKFAGELVRMSNYEIIDLRKRNSLGLVYPLNGHRKHSLEQQAALEEGIRLEILRRNLDVNEIEDVSSNKTQDEEVPRNNSTSMVPPASVVPRKTSHRSSRSRSRRQQIPMTREKANYMALEKTMKERRKSRSTTKRSLYTKGDSETEDNYYSSPEKQRRISVSYTGPESVEDFAIIPPPPAWQSLRELDNQNHSTVKDMEKSTENLRLSVFNKKLENSHRSIQPVTKPDEISEAVGPPPDSDDDGDDDEVSLEQTTLPHEQKEAQSSKEKSALFTRTNDLSQQKENEEMHVFCSSKARTNMDKNVVDFSDEREEDDQLQSCHNHSNSIRVRNLDELMPESPNRSILERRSSGRVEQMPKRMSDKASYKKKTTNKEKSKKSSNKKTLSKSLTNSDELEMESENPKVCKSGGCFADDSIGNVQIENMEALRIATPPASDVSINNVVLDDEQPSTSKAAREALQRSIGQRKQQSKSTSKNDAVIFKKPLTPAPRARKNKSKLEKELDKLKISIPLNGTIMSNFDKNVPGDQDTKIRRSKRGQVPLKNNFCHTIKDLTQLDFVRMSLQTHKNPIPKPKKVKSAKPESRSKESDTDFIVTRPPLCSSTPCSVEPPVMIRKTSQQSSNGPMHSPSSSSIGVSPFSDQEDNHTETTPLNTSNKRKKEKKPKVKRPPAKHPASSKILPPIPENSTNVEVATQSDPEPYIPNVFDDDQSSNQFTSWLHGSKTIDTTGHINSQENHITSVKDLVFKNLEGIDYAFYNTAEKTSLGYMRFKPHQTREKKRSKSTTMKFIVQCGQFSVETVNDSRESETVVLRHGEMIEIENGTYYSITNMLDIVGVLMFIRI